MEGGFQVLTTFVKTQIRDYRVESRDIGFSSGLICHSPLTIHHLYSILSTLKR
jgi:hypothetical protein